MTSSTATRPSYKEAQERLLKWCQHVTRNYEVSDTASDLKDELSVHLLFLVGEDSQFHGRLRWWSGILCNSSPLFSGWIRFQSIEPRRETEELRSRLSDRRVSPMDFFVNYRSNSFFLCAEKKHKFILYSTRMILFMVLWIRNVSSPISSHCTMAWRIAKHVQINGWFARHYLKHTSLFLLFIIQFLVSIVFNVVNKNGWCCFNKFHSDKKQRERATVRVSIGLTSPNGKPHRHTSLLGRLSTLVIRRYDLRHSFLLRSAESFLSGSIFDRSLSHFWAF